MTMMGSQDLRRLIKGMRLDEELDRRLRAGLRRRADELEADLDAVEEVASLLAPSASEEQRADLDELDGHCEQWREFIEFLRSDFEPSMDDLRRLLLFSAIRSNTLNCLGRFPGGHGALVNISEVLAKGEGASEPAFAKASPFAKATGDKSADRQEFRPTFRFSGRRRIAPPRCLYYLDPEGCLAGDCKPAKCANFFCGGEPNLLAEMRAALSFDDFVLSNFSVIGLERLLEHLRLEQGLGPEFVEPKILLGVEDRALADIEGALAACGIDVRVEPLGGSAMRSAAEAEAALAETGPAQASIEVYDHVDGNVLYELALALDRIRLRDEHPRFVLAARALRPAPMPHPMWDDQMMSQPLGALDMFVLADEP
jgi:hypothetical protein